MTTLFRDPEQRLDSLLGHCMMRAVIAAEGGLDGAREKYGPDASVSKWTGLKVVAKVTPKASRVAGFVALWAVAMKMENRDEFTITEYERYWNEGERQTFRLQKEFRELWPEFETPNELARHIVEQIDARASKKDVATLPMRLMVMA
ncbi:MAG TPA: hypothetical protein VHC67_14290 [Gaiellaceae bacterium]|nr:hypothetical protein [Gaiellaceae bacterium]